MDDGSLQRRCCLPEARSWESERLVVVGSNKVVLRRAHGGAHGERAGNVGDGGGDGEAGEVVVAGFGRLLLERAELVVFVVEVLLVEAAQRLAVLSRLVGATMSGNVSGGRVTARRDAYWARLSEREKALLQSEHTYGRSWVWVRTCLGARSAAVKTEAGAYLTS